MAILIWDTAIQTSSHCTLVVQSFLFYVPYAVLAAMTFPAVIYSADGLVPGIAGTFTGLVFAYKRKSLLMVAVVSCIAVFITEMLCKWI